MNDFTAELDAGIQAVIQAATACRSVQSAITPESLEKKDRSPVTIADFASQAIVCAHLQKRFPDDPVIGEEDSAALREGEASEFLNAVCHEVNQAGLSGTSNEICDWIDRGGSHEFSPRFWTLDPIDGTKGFLRNEQYAISLALIIDGQIQVAVLGCPNLPCTPGQTTGGGSLFCAIRGAGAWVADMNRPEQREAVQVRDISGAEDAILCESVESGHSAHGHSSEVAKLLGITSSPVRLDSQAKYATVARGEADIYLRLPTRKDYHEKIWDHAGGVLVVEEAGGQVSDVLGRPLDFTCGFELRQNRGVVVTNGQLHSAVLEALRSVGVE